MNTFKTDKFIQSYLFFGPHGTGKTSLARIFAKAINCLSFDGIDVCNKCESCISINNHSALDIVEIDAASNNGVEFMRELVSNIQFLPLSLNKKIYIIDEAHSLSSQSWTALLKAIEEPPSHIIFLFLTTQIGKIMPTIYSRCQKFQFTFLSKTELVDLTKEVFEIENKVAKTGVLERIVALSKGSARELLTICDQLFLHDEKEITDELFERTFYVLSNGRLLEISHLLFSNKIQKSINFLNDCIQDGLNIKSIFEGIFDLLLDICIYKKTQNCDLLQNHDVESIKTFLEYHIDCLSLMKFISDNLWKLDKAEHIRPFSKFILLNIIEIANKLPSEILKIENTPKRNEYSSTQKKIERDDSKTKVEIDSTILENVWRAPELQQKTETLEEKNGLFVQLPADTNIDLKIGHFDRRPKKNPDDIDFNEKSMFETKTLFIFPETISSTFNEEKLEINYDPKILYTLTNANKKLSNKNLDKVLLFLQKEKNNSICHNLLQPFLQKFSILSTDISCVVIFETEQETLLFNKSYEEQLVKDELAEILGKKNHWFALSNLQLMKYHQKSKEYSKDSFDVSKLFEEEQKEIFDKYLAALSN